MWPFFFKYNRIQPKQGQRIKITKLRKVYNGLDGRWERNAYEGSVGTVESTYDDGGFVLRLDDGASLSFLHPLYRSEEFVVLGPKPSELFRRPMF